MRVAGPRELFRTQFGGDPLVVRSPGRVNLIGEHTDYNDGFVLPATVDRAIVLAVAPAVGRRCRLLAADLSDSTDADLDDLQRSPRGWPNYLLGVVDQLRRSGTEVPGFDCVFGGDIPPGAGMSSSAAIEAGLAFALNELFSFGLDRRTLAKLARNAEHDFVGVRCGIMDQFANLFGSPGHALKLDCRSLEFELVPFADPKVHIVLCDSGIKHALAGSEYNVRRHQCEEGVAALQRTWPAVLSLRDVDLEMLDRQRAELDPDVYRRCRHVVEENKRLLAGCDELRRGDLAGFGQRMYDSHRGLRDDYSVSCSELDILVEIAAGIEGVYGARMMGGGFGGCTINLVQADAVVEFSTAVTARYGQRTGWSPRVFVTQIAGGTAVEA